MSSFVITNQLPTANRGAGISDLFSEGYNERSYSILKRVSDERVRQITVLRSPLPAVMEAGIDALSNGQWTELKHQAGFDVFYHLAVVINGRVLIEKNSYGININYYEPYLAESIDVPSELLRNTPNTIWGMLDKTELTMKGNYFSYSPFRNNCQNFIFNLLSSNNVIDDQLVKFIYQPIDELVAKLDSYVEPAVNIATRLHGLQALVQLEGSGLPVTITIPPGEVFHHDTRFSFPKFLELYKEGDRKYIWFYKYGSAANHGGQRMWFKSKYPLTLFNLDSFEGADSFLEVLQGLPDSEKLVEAFKSKMKPKTSGDERPKYITAGVADQTLAAGLFKHIDILPASGWKMTMAGSTADPEYLVIEPKLFFHEPTKKRT
jgi:hypothetical protein